TTHSNADAAGSRSTTWRSPSPSTSTGTTTAASTASSPNAPQPRSRRRTGPRATISPPSSPGHGDRQRSLHQTRGATLVLPLAVLVIRLDSALLCHPLLLVRP